MLSLPISDERVQQREPDYAMFSFDSHLRRTCFDLQEKMVKTFVANGAERLGQFPLGRATLVNAGSGSLSFEMVRYLTERLPIMILRGLFFIGNSLNV